MDSWYVLYTTGYSGDAGYWNTIEKILVYQELTKPLTLKYIHTPPIKSKILSLKPLSTRESPVTQKPSQEPKMLRTLEQRQS